MCGGWVSFRYEHSTHRSTSKNARYQSASRGQAYQWMSRGRRGSQHYQSHEIKIPTCFVQGWELFQNGRASMDVTNPILQTQTLPIHTMTQTP